MADVARSPDTPFTIQSVGHVERVVTSQDVTSESGDDRCRSLFGDGLSQSFSGELSLGRTTQRVRDRIGEGNHVDTQLLDEVATEVYP